MMNILSFLLFSCTILVKSQGECPCGMECSTRRRGIEDCNTCLLCQKGFYNDESSPNCYMCPSGHKCPDFGMCEPIQCGAGYYRSIPGGISCDCCGEGEENNIEHTSCRQCSSGSVSPGCSSCTSCKAGEIPNAQNSLCIACPAGYYCPVGTGQQIRCPSGTFSTGSASSINHCDCCIPRQKVNTGQTGCVACSALEISFPAVCSEDCVSCPPGRYVDVAHNECDRCENGYYCPGDGVMHECDPWKYSAKTSDSANDCQCCLSGTELNTERSGCDDCQAGHYSSNCWETCQICGIGTYANDDHTSCLSCPNGFYCPAGGEKIDCGTGRWSNLGSQSALDCRCCNTGDRPNAQRTGCEDCPSNSVTQSCVGVCQVCSAGRYPDAIQGSCLDCPNGWYCNVGYRYECPEYTWSPTRSENLADCQCCPAGEYVKDDRSGCNQCSESEISDLCSDSCTPCPPGRYAGENHAICLQCPAGFYCEPRKTLCPPGMISDPGSDSSADCYCCTAGTFKKEIIHGGAYSCQACASGSISSSCAGSCNVCSNGRYEVNNIACRNCPAGSYCRNGIRYSCPSNTYSLPASSQVADCVCCPAGSEVNGAQDGCDLCGGNKRSDECGQCECCPGGTKNDQNVCTPCIAGQFSLPCDIDCGCCSSGWVPLGSTGTCVECEPGRVADACDPVCEFCPAGTYANANHDHCETCTPGSYCEQGIRYDCSPGYYSLAGATSSSDCLCCGVGQQPNANKDGCEACPQGTFSDGCLPCTCCDHGWVANAQLSGCDKCPGNQVALACSTTGVCECCPAGEYARADRSRCDICEPGSVEANTCSDQCTFCSPGYFQEAGNHLACVRCPGGTYNSLDAQTECVECPKPTQVPSNERTACRECRPGYECTNGIETECPAGHFCTNGTAKECRPGEHALQGVNLACEVCEIGYFCTNGEKKKCAVSSYCPPGAPQEIDCGCSSHGSCWNGPFPQFACFCFEGYTEPDCSVFTCFGKNSEDDKVCSKRGVCMGYNTCICFEGFGGNRCSKHTCFGVEYTSPAVCSKNGACKNVDQCICRRGWMGRNCSTPTARFTEKDVRTLLSIVIPFISLACTIVIVLVLVAVCAKRLCDVQRGQLKKYQGIEDLDVLLLEESVTKSEMSMSEVSLKIDKSLFEIEFSDIAIKRKIASGAGGAVYLCDWRRNICAFKLFFIHTVMDEGEKYTEFERELSILASTHHPYILEFYGAVLKVPRMGILMKYAENGNLKSFLMKYCKENGRIYPLEERIRQLREICLAMEHLHSMGIIHRDLKCENVVIEKDFVAKVCDFGCAKGIEFILILNKKFFSPKVISGENKDSEKTLVVGTSVYMAPEVSIGSGGIGSYDEKIILAWMALTNNFEPYGSSPGVSIQNQVARRNLRPPISEMAQQDQDDEVPDWLRELVSRSWDAEPSKRPSFATWILEFGKNWTILKKPGIPKRKPTPSFFDRFIVRKGNTTSASSSNPSPPVPNTNKRRVRGKEKKPPMLSFFKRKRPPKPPNNQISRDGDQDREDIQLLTREEMKSDSFYLNAAKRKELPLPPGGPKHAAAAPAARTRIRRRDEENVFYLNAAKRKVLPKVPRDVKRAPPVPSSRTQKRPPENMQS